MTGTGGAVDTTNKTSKVKKHHQRSMASTKEQDFSIGISAEQQLSMPLGASALLLAVVSRFSRRFLTVQCVVLLQTDALIQQSKKAAPKAAPRKKPVTVKLKQHNVKKTVVVPVSKAMVLPLPC